MPKFNEKNQNLNANNITSGTVGSPYLPTATTSALGAIKVDGITIGINNGAIYSIPGSTAGASSMITKVFDKPNSHRGFVGTAYKRANGALVELGGLHYLVGGYTDASNTIGTISNTIGVFDPIKYTNTTIAATMLTPRFAHSAVVFGGKIYVFGGLNSSNAVVNTVEVFDPATNAWSLQATNPSGGVSFGRAVIYGGEVHLLGGIATGSVQTARHQVYNIGTDTWTTATVIPNNLHSFAIMATSTGILIAGGNNGSATNVTRFWTGANDTWSTRATKNYSGNCAGAGNGTKMLSINFLSASEAEVYDFGADTWTITSTIVGGLTRNGVHLAYSSLDQMVYVQGGTAGASASTFSWYDPYSFTNMDWGKLPRVKTRRHSFGVATVDNKAYVIGGATATGGSSVGVNTNEMYDPSTRTWTTKANMTTARRNFAMASVGTKIYCIGGTSTGSDYLNTVEIYDTVANTWSTGTAMTTSRSHTCCAVVGTVIYVFTGKTSALPNGTDVVEAYDTVANTWSTKAVFPIASFNCAAFTYSVSGNPYVLAGNTAVSTGTVNGLYEYSVTGNSWASRGNTNGQTFLDLYPQMIEMDGVLYAWVGAFTSGLLFSVPATAANITGSITTATATTSIGLYNSGGDLVMADYKSVYGGMVKISETQGNTILAFIGATSNAYAGPILGVVDAIVGKISPHTSTGVNVVQHYLNTSLTNNMSGVTNTILPVKIGDTITYRTISLSPRSQYFTDELFFS